MHEVIDQELGTAALLLLDGGHTEAASLLSRASDVTTQWQNEWSGVTSYHWYIEIDYSLMPMANEAVRQAVREALDKLGLIKSEAAASVTFVPALVAGDWRSAVSEAIDGRPSNQGSLGSAKSTVAAWPSADGMRFRDAGEVSLFEALKRCQSSLPAQRTFTIAPGPSVKVAGHVWEVDFLIVYKGKAGVIEVDGATHHRKYASDRSRDKKLEDCGVLYVDRIDVQDTHSPEVEAFVERFINKLGSLSAS